MAYFLCKIFPHVSYLDAPDCSFAFDKYVFLNDTFEYRCPPRYLTLVDLSSDSPMMLIVLWVVLLSCYLLSK